MTLNRIEAPAFKAIENFELLKAEAQTLSNKIPVYSVNAGTQELVKIEFVFSAGVWNQTLSLQASCTNAMLDEGTTTRTAAELADSIDYYGAYLELDVNQDWASITLYTLNKHLENVLPYIEDVIKNPIFPENEFNILIQNKHQQYLVDNEKVGHVARTRFSGIIFDKKSPYSYTLEDADFKKINRNHLIEFYKKNYNPGNCQIILSGKLSNSLIPLLDKHFGGADWKLETPEIKNSIPLFNASTEKKHFILKDDAVQSAIRVGRILFNKTHNDYHGMKVLNTILGGYFGSRLMNNIREDKGYTYGIGSRLVSLKNAGYFFISTEVGAKVTNDALKEIYIEIKKLQTELVSANELELVKNYILGDFLRSIDGPFALADKFKKIMLYNIDYDYYNNFVKTVKSITAEQLNALANTYLNENDLTELVVGKK